MKKSKEIRQMVEGLGERLYRCAHINSHKVRGPLARIMGLVEVRRLDRQVDCDWFFKTIRYEAESIDKITREVARELDRIEKVKSKLATSRKPS